MDDRGEEIGDAPRRAPRGFAGAGPMPPAVGRPSTEVPGVGRPIPPVPPVDGPTPVPTRSRVGIYVVMAALAAALGGGIAWKVANPPPPTPWVDRKPSEQLKAVEGVCEGKGIASAEPYEQGQVGANAEVFLGEVRPGATGHVELAPIDGPPGATYLPVALTPRLVACLTEVEDLNVETCSITQGTPGEEEREVDLVTEASYTFDLVEADSGDVLDQATGDTAASPACPAFIPIERQNLSSISDGDPVSSYAQVVIEGIEEDAVAALIAHHQG